MKSKKILIISVSLLGLLSACYDDKGNYDYKDLTGVEIKHTSSPSSVTFGETVKLTPEISFAKEDPNLKLSYSWILEGEEISTDPVLEWVADRYTKEKGGNLLLEITDIASGLVYRMNYSLTVVQKYDTYGPVLLSKKDGKICVHMLKEGYDEDDKRIFVPAMNLYTLENEKAEMPANVFKMHQHYAYYDDAVHRQLMFVAPDQTLEVDPCSFYKVDTKLSDMFGGALPGGLMVSDVHFMQFLNIITDGEGHVYTRVKSTNEFFHIDNFLPTPLKFQGEELRDIELIPSHLTSQHCLMLDKNKNRVLVIWDYYDRFGHIFTVGKVDEINSEISTAIWPDAVPKIEDVLKNYEILHIAPFKTEYGSYGDGLKTHYFSVIKNKETGKLYHYEFCLEQKYGTAAMSFATKNLLGSKVVDIVFTELTGKADELFGDPQNKIYTLPVTYLGYEYKGNVTMIAHGNTLYVYNRLIPVSDVDTDKTLRNPRVLCSFGANIGLITSIDGSYSWGEYMGIALNDGSFEVLSLKNAQYSNWNGRLWKSEGIDLGTPIDLFYNQGNPGLDDWSKLIEE